MPATPLHGWQMTEPASFDVPDDLLPIAAIARAWPAKKGGVSPGLVFRFADKGRRGVVLRTLDVPGVGLCSCQQWVKDFIAALNRPQVTQRGPAKTSTFHKPRLRDLGNRRPPSATESM